MLAAVLLAYAGVLAYQRWMGRDALPPGPHPSPPPGAVADHVVRVIDGDTIETRELGRVRYIGVDTPEMNAPDPDVRRMARMAREANVRLVGGRTVLLATDVQERDRYGRTLAYVWTADRQVMVNAWLLEQGYARVLTVPPNVRYADFFVALQQRARREGRGLWR
ncbi:MAG: thermonuclease family protein [Limnochordaceae bacterium]|nr:thermonuclease family protein [Limnochordaceae bacterium]